MHVTDSTHLAVSADPQAIFVLRTHDARFFQALWDSRRYAPNPTAEAALQQLAHAHPTRRTQVLSAQPLQSVEVCWQLAQRDLPTDIGLAAWLAAHEGITQAQQDIEARADAVWLRLTPVHWLAGRDHVTVHPFYGDFMASPDAQDRADWQQIWGDLVGWLDGMNWQLYPSAHAPQVWVRAEAGFDYRAPSWEYAHNDILESALPSGNDLKRWQTLLTELQMLLHTHPLNLARQARGARSINGFWLDQAAAADALPAEVTRHAPPDLKLPLAQWTEADDLTRIGALIQPVQDALNRHGQARLVILSDTEQDQARAVAHEITFTQMKWWQKWRSKTSRSTHPFVWLTDTFHDSNTGENA